MAEKKTSMLLIGVAWVVSLALLLWFARLFGGLGASAGMWTVLIGGLFWLAVLGALTWHINQLLQKIANSDKEVAAFKQKKEARDAEHEGRLREREKMAQDELSALQDKLQVTEKEKKAQREELAARIQYLEEELIRIRGYIRANDGCTYDSVDKCWVEDKTSERYCAVCMDKNIRSPCVPTIIKGTPSMKCSVCGG